MTDVSSRTSDRPWPDIDRSTAEDLPRACHACFWAWIACHLTFSLNLNEIHIPLNLLVGLPYAFRACAALRRTGPPVGCGLAGHLLFVFWPVLTTVGILLGFTRAAELQEVVDTVGLLGTGVCFTLIFRAWARGFGSPVLKNAHRMMSRLILWYALPQAAVYSWVFILNLEQGAPGAVERIQLNDLAAGMAPQELAALVVLLLLLYATHVCLLVYPLVAFHRFRNAWQEMAVGAFTTASGPPNPLELSPDDSADEAAGKIATAQDLRYRCGIRREGSE